MPEHTTHDWFDKDPHSSCTLGTRWELTNTGNSPLSIKDINYSLFAIADDNNGPQPAAFKDMSIGQLIDKGELIASNELLPSEDFATSGGKISRDISVVYQPASDNPEHWFETHRLVFVITSVVDKYGKSWCPFCDDTKFKAENVSKPQYVCSKNSPKSLETK